ncbi:MAG: AMP-binding protein [Dehalococcoidia bacterium]
MPKGAVGLASLYWPDDIFRYLPIPSIYLEEGLVERPATKFPDRAALVFDSRVLTYGQLATEMERGKNSILVRLGDHGSRVAIAVAEPADLVPLFLGCLKARCSIWLVDLSFAPEDLARQMDAFKPDLVVAEQVTAPKLAELGGHLALAYVSELRQSETELSQTGLQLDPKSPAIALSGREGRLCYHSHSSLLAGAVSWSAFVPLKEGEVVMNLQPLYAWEGLYGLAPALFQGGTCIMSDPQDPERLARDIGENHPSFTWFTKDQMDRLFVHPNRGLLHAVRQNLQGIFLTVSGLLKGGERRRWGNLLETAVLTVYGWAETGPVLCSHPTWYLEGAVGIQVSNADIWPLSPATGNPLQVSWDAMEYGEIGVRSPMTAVAYETPEEASQRLRGGWLRTGTIATMDPNGLFYLRPA